VRLVALLDLSKGDAVRITIRMAIRFSCGGKAAYDRDRWSLSIFKTPVLPHNCDVLLLPAGHPSFLAVKHRCRPVLRSGNHFV